jgi:hypothetical protein
MSCSLSNLASQRYAAEPDVIVRAPTIQGPTPASLENVLGKNCFRPHFLIDLQCASRRGRTQMCDSCMWGELRKGQILMRAMKEYSNLL